MRWAIILILFGLMMPQGGNAAPKSDLWAKWRAHDPASTDVIDHSMWDKFLSRYVVSSPDGINRVAYGKVTTADKMVLHTYIQGLSRLSVSTFNRNQQRAFWINLYNALTLEVILDHYPVSTIRKINISPGFFSSGPWGKKLLQIESEDISLDDIEHRILRPIWKDARLHYGLNCASLGCPNLQTKAFRAANTEGLLDKGAREYINHPRGVSFRDGRLTVSSIYHWFKEDFGGNDQGVIRHLMDFASPDLKGTLKNVTKISDDDYDWSLNE